MEQAPSTLGSHRGSLKRRSVRSKSFWQVKLVEAEDRLRLLETRLHNVTVQAGFDRRRLETLKRRHQQPLKREMLGLKLDRARTVEARLKREIRKLQTTKIPYYQERLAAESRTIWDHVRRDGLRI